MNNLNSASNPSFSSENAQLDVSHNFLPQDIFQQPVRNKSTQQLYSFEAQISQSVNGLACESCPTSTQYFNSDVAPLVRLALQGFSESADFAEKINKAFGYGANVEQGRSLINNLAAGSVFPDIKILSPIELQAKGAFGNDTI